MNRRGWMGVALPCVVSVASAIWISFGATANAAPELLASLCFGLANC
jgi:hypothetical protein